MAIFTVTVFTCFLLTTVFSSPILSDKKSVQFDDTVHDFGLIKRNFAVDPKKYQNLDEDSVRDIKLVGSLGSVGASLDAVVARSVAKIVKRLRRTKREAIVSHKCPKGWHWYGSRCITDEKYQEIMRAENEEK